MHQSKWVFVGAVLVVLGSALAWLLLREAPSNPKPTTKPSASIPRIEVKPTRRLADRANLRRAADPKGTIRLEGQVIDEQEDPVADAVVTISSSPPRFVRTEGDGSFVVTGLLPMSYTIEASANDSYAGPAIVTPREDSEPLILRMRQGHTLSVEVRDADDNTPVRGAQVDVRTGGAMSWQTETNDEGATKISGVRPGLATLHIRAEGYAPFAMRIVSAETQVLLQRGARVSGTVLGPGGAPVPGAEVIAVPASEPFSLLDARDAVGTDNSGAFHFAALRPGSYRMRVLHSDYTERDAALVRVGSQPLTDLVLLMDPGGMVHGTVRQPDGTPVAGAQVQFVGRGSVAWRARSSVATGDDGRFEIRGLPRTRGDLVASSGESSSELALVDLAEGEIEQDLVLDVTGTISGVVRSSSGDIVPEAQVVITPVWKGTPLERAAWDARGIGIVLSDAGGRFSISGLLDGEYSLWAAHPGAPASDAFAIEAIRASVGQDDVTVPLADRARVTGTVVKEDGSAVSAFAIRVGNGAPLAFSSASGGFALLVPTGKRTLEVTGPGILPTKVEIQIDTLTHDAGSIVTKTGRALTGVVVDASGEPVADALVAAGALLTGDGSQLFIPDESLMAQTTKTDEEGRFSIQGLGAFSVTVVAGTANARSRYVRLPASPESAEVTLALEPTSSLHGIATLGGEPIAETVIMASSLATSGMHFVVSGKDGRFAFDALAPGAYSVYPMIGGGGTKPKDMYLAQATVVEGESREVTIAAELGSTTIRVQAEDEDGKPANGHLFVVEDPNAIVAEGTYPPDIFTDGTWLRGRELEKVVRVSLRSSGAEPARIEGLVAGRYAACFGAKRFGPPGPVTCRAVTLEAGDSERLITLSASSAP